MSERIILTTRVSVGLNADGERVYKTECEDVSLSGMSGAVRDARTREGSSDTLNAIVWTMSDDGSASLWYAIGYFTTGGGNGMLADEKAAAERFYKSL